MTRSTCLAVITARGGSKGVPRKNIRELNGRPVIAYAIRVARDCPHITKTVVTTDSPEIQAIALQCGAEAPFLRPAELATDTAKQEDAILHTMGWYEARGERFDYVCLLEPTTPLRQVATLNQGFERLASHPDAEAIFSVSECEFSPVFCNTLRADGFLKDWMDEKYKWLNRQEIPAYYQLSPLVIISTWDAFKTAKTFLHDRTLSLIIDTVEARDIDSPLDFFIVDRLMERGWFRAEQLSEQMRQRDDARPVRDIASQPNGAAT